MCLCALGRSWTQHTHTPEGQSENLGVSPSFLVVWDRSHCCCIYQAGWLKSSWGIFWLGLLPHCWSTGVLQMSSKCMRYQNDFCHFWEGEFVLTQQVIYSLSHLPIPNIPFVLLLISLPTVRFPYGSFIDHSFWSDPQRPLLSLTKVLRQHSRASRILILHAWFKEDLNWTWCLWN